MTDPEHPDDPSDATCPTHGGTWGVDETCPTCVDEDGHPLRRVLDLDAALAGTGFRLAADPAVRAGMRSFVVQLADCPNARSRIQIDEHGGTIDYDSLVDIHANGVYDYEWLPDGHRGGTDTQRREAVTSAVHRLLLGATRQLAA